MSDSVFVFDVISSFPVKNYVVSSEVREVHPPPRTL
jgi:hypothetical protein